MSEVKSIWQSKTIWANALIIVLAALDALQLLPAVPPGWAPYILAGQGFLNVVLRLTTSSGIAGFAPPAVPLGEQPAYRAAHDASGNPDAMRAPRSGTSGEDAPTPDVPDRAPSLAAQIAADNGLDPEAAPRG